MRNLTQRQRWTVPMVSAAMVAACLAPTTSLAAVPPGGEPIEPAHLPPAALFVGEASDTVTLSAAAGLELRSYAVGDFVPWEVLKENGYGEPEEVVLGSDAVIDQDLEPTAWPADTYHVLESWYDKNGRYVLERTGQHKGQANNAFGWRHAYYDHNMNTNAIQVTTKKYFSYELYQAYRYNYRAVLIHLSCTNTQGCWIIDELTSRVAMDRSTYGSSIFGLVTAYCEGYTRCPSWVHTVK